LKGKLLSNSDVPAPCRECYRWEQWKRNCSFFWNSKKECGSKVKDHDEMVSLDQMRRR